MKNCKPQQKELYEANKTLTEQAVTLKQQQEELEVNNEELEEQTQSIELKNDKSATILISAELNKWFKNIHDLPIAMNPACVMPGNLATQYAENYSGMFQITQIENN